MGRAVTRSPPGRYEGVTRHAQRLHARVQCDRRVGDGPLRAGRDPGEHGRQDRQARSAPLGYVARADGTVVVGSGRPENRGWVVNLRANPACTFRIKGTERRYGTRLLSGDEREAALAELRATVGSMAERMTWGDVFVLEPER